MKKFFVITMLLVVGLFTSTGGCSTIFVQGPPANYDQHPYCTQSMFWPAIDGISAVFSATGAVIWALAPLEDEQGNEIGNRQRAVFAGVNALLSGLYLASAISGRNKVRKCRALQPVQFVDLSPDKPVDNSRNLPRLQPDNLPFAIARDQSAR